MRRFSKKENRLFAADGIPAGMCMWAGSHSRVDVTQQMGVCKGKGGMYGDKRGGVCMEARQKRKSRHLDCLLTRDRDRVVHEGWMVSQ